MVRLDAIATQAVHFARMMRRVPNSAWARRLVAYGVPCDAVTYDRTTGRVSFNHADISLRFGDSDLILRSFNYAISLSRYAGVKFEQQISGSLLAQWPTGTAVIETVEEIFILHELLVSGYYDFGVHGEVVVWDIGMNVGLATLAFAAMPCVKGVVAYEPFQPTYARALANIGLNPALANRIQTYNAGIGPANAVLRVPWSTDCPGSASTTPEVMPSPECGDIHEVTIRGAVEALSEIQTKYPGVTIAAKVDCEGAEYGIIRALHDAGVLSSIGLVMIEWHVNGPTELVSMLTSAGFVMFSLATVPTRTGILFGANRQT